MEFQETAQYSFTPHCSLVNYRRGKRTDVTNNSEFTIHIKEYAPCVFSYYRELNTISVSSIISCFESFWRPSTMNQKQFFSVIQIDHRKKNSLLTMMRSLLTVVINMWVNPSTVVFMKFAFFLYFAAFFEFELSNNDFCSMEWSLLILSRSYHSPSQDQTVVFVSMDLSH